MRTTWVGIGLVGLLLSGCAASDLKPGQAVLPAVPFLTKDTGVLTIPRQPFINTWGMVQVLWSSWMTQQKAFCAAKIIPPDRCAKLPEIEEQGRIVFVTVEGKLRNPEAEIDWENVAKIAQLIAKFVI
jgi:hypothetical protein